MEASKSPTLSTVSRGFLPQYLLTPEAVGYFTCYWGYSTCYWAFHERAMWCVCVEVWPFLFEAMFGRLGLGSHVASLPTFIVLRRFTSGEEHDTFIVPLLMDTWVVFNICLLWSVLICVFLNIYISFSKCGELSSVCWVQLLDLDL